MTRRDALRNCFIIAVGSTLIPACKQETKPVLPLKHLSINGNDEKLISDLCETIIPKTDTPGAKDTYTHLFVLKMLDDMYSKDEQDRFINGMKAFDKLADKKFDKSFADCTQQQKDELVGTILKDKSVSKDVTDFFETTKKLAIQGYVTSKYYLTNVQEYKLVPGKFKGCIPVAVIKEKGASI